MLVAHLPFFSLVRGKRTTPDPRCKAWQVRSKVGSQQSQHSNHREAKCVHTEVLLPRLHLLLADLDPVVVEGDAVNMEEGEAVNMAGGHDPVAPVVPLGAPC